MKIPEDVDFSSSVLFLGSGFSTSARNIAGDAVPSGFTLKTIFADRLKIDAAALDLQTITDYAIQTAKIDVYRLLADTFTIESVSTFQRDLIQLPWLRIYTTNYDDAIEFTKLQLNLPINSFTFHDVTPKHLPDGSVIHLHGAIGKTNPDNVEKQLVLHEASYVLQFLERSPWFTRFEQDHTYADATFFVGYSLSDHAISSLLMKNPITQSKTFFITPNAEAVLVSRLKSYGQHWPIDGSEFVRLCQMHRQPRPIENLATLTAFKSYDPFKDRRVNAPPTALEVRTLMTYGNFDSDRYLSTVEADYYVAPRKGTVESAFQKINASRSLIVHSDIGNGKSVFLTLLAKRLVSAGFRCFLFRGEAPRFQQEINLLKSIPKLIIVIDSYDVAIEIASHLSIQLPLAKFVVSAQTSVMEVRWHELETRMPSLISIESLNTLIDEDRVALRALLDRAGLTSSSFDDTFRRCKSLREVVLLIYNNKGVKDAIEQKFVDCSGKEGVGRVLIATQLLKLIGRELDADFIRLVTGVDPYATFLDNRELLADMLSIDGLTVRANSAAFSEFALKTFFSATEVLNIVYEIAVATVRRKHQREYRAVLSDLTKATTLRRLLSERTDRLELIETLYDRLHRDININDEPLFWLQYAILMSDKGDLRAAESFVQTAYLRANASRNFETYQIDTFALQLLLLLEKSEPANVPVSRFDELVRLLGLATNMVAISSHREYLNRSLSGLEDFVNCRIEGLGLGERIHLVMSLNQLIASMESKEDRLYPERILLESISRAKNRLVFSD